MHLPSVLPADSAHPHLPAGCPNHFPYFRKVQSVRDFLRTDPGSPDHLYPGLPGSPDLLVTPDLPVPPDLPGSPDLPVPLVLPAPGALILLL